MAARADATDELGVPISAEQRRYIKKMRRAGFVVVDDTSGDHRLTRLLDRFEELSSREQRAELERPGSPWDGYLWEYDGFRLTILGRVTSLRPAALPPVVELAPQRVRPRARTPRTRRARTGGGSRDRPRPSADDDDPEPVAATGGGA